MTAIELHGVTKQFADVTAVDDLDLAVEEGEIYGFLGPNGAGKSTTINMVLDLVRPTTGTVTVLGRDATADSVDIRRRTGVLPEGFSVYDRLSGRKHVEFAIESKEADAEPEALLERVGLSPEDWDRKAGGYSKGMCQRLALAMALVGEPELLILDEPSSGLDPAGAKEMRDIVRAEADRGATVFFSSHVLGQVEAVCDRVGILRDGTLVAEDSIEGLRDAVGGEETLDIETAGVDETALESVRALEGVSQVTRVEGSDGRIRVNCADDAKTRVIGALEDAGVGVSDFHTEEASLEDLFLAYTEGDSASPGTDGDDEETAEAPTDGDEARSASDDEPEGDDDEPEMEPEGTERDEAGEADGTGERAEAEETEETDEGTEETDEGTEETDETDPTATTEEVER
ncbi:ABC-2 type transport system ATP-binding protein [Halorubrum vacuolatum]|uniref:ABC-2 type transport system ATP-binding protein n=1 Tax=Halorubrum vacuolatum TaxID=63740 RepID=A0A238WD96_HALVU|nr:ABC-2 type transport system ATP-binding protein [Halorubrum vacuolatum]